MAVAFAKWNTEEVGQFLNEAGLGAYSAGFIENDILGKHLTLLTKDDLKELGVTALGDRLAMTKEIQALKVKEKMKRRKEKVAEHIQAWDGTCVDKSFQTCCGLFPWDPDRYILTSTNLRIKEYELFRLCGMCKCTMCGGTWTSDNIPLNKIIDIDAEHYTTGMCCFKENKCILKLQGVAGNQADSETSRLQSRNLLVEGDVGDEFQKLLRNTIEDYKLEVGPQGKMD